MRVAPLFFSMQTTGNEPLPPQDINYTQITKEIFEELREDFRPMESGRSDEELIHERNVEYMQAARDIAEGIRDTAEENYIGAAKDAAEAGIHLADAVHANQELHNDTKKQN